LQFYAENNQEAVDLMLASYKIAEQKKIMLPAMVCVDGFILTHGMEVVDIPGQKEVDKFLPAYNPPYKLDVNDPMSFGLLGDPSVYLETRYAIQKTMEDVIPLVGKVSGEFKSIFGRDSVRLVEEYKLDDADVALVAMGSVCGTIKDVVDRQRQQGRKIGLLKIVTYRPLPQEQIKASLAKVKNIAVLDKNISLGAEGALFTEIKSLFDGNKNISGFIAGLGGRDITVGTVKDIINSAEEESPRCKFMDINKDILWEEFHAV
jgi:pyruvate ferredoxin oxidoreductase alpha subunit